MTKFENFIIIVYILLFLSLPILWFLIIWTDIDPIFISKLLGTNFITLLFLLIFGKIYNTLKN